jgi:hypothetical protein
MESFSFSDNALISVRGWVSLGADGRIRYIAINVMTSSGVDQPSSGLQHSTSTIYATINTTIDKNIMLIAH